MGALHDGHEALIRLGVDTARDRAAPGGCVVTIFVNPTQFNDPEDYAHYPQTRQADLERCRACGVDVVYVPPVEDVYPPDAATPVPPLPRVATEPGLEDRGRPGHFEGVCQVLARLWGLTGAAASIFGEKDWQQYQVARALSAQLGLGVDIIAGATVREPDGLAMSSRNVHLSDEARRAAGRLRRALLEAGQEPTPRDAEATMARVLDHPLIRTDYAVVRDAETLVEPTPATTAHRAVVTAIVGGVRLLDNAPWPDAE